MAVAAPRTAKPTDEVQATHAPRVAQRALTVGPASDPSEIEADRLADLVVDALSASGPALDGTAGALNPRAQRSATLDRPTAAPAARVQRVRRSVSAPATAQPIGPDGGDVDTDVATRIQRARGGGSPLPRHLRRSMEGAFGGVDFGGVRVHTGGEASALSERLGAEAFTVGSDIHFSHGLPDTASTAGQHLVAHELTHTLQAGRTARRSPSSLPIGTFAQPSANERYVIRRSIAAVDRGVNKTAQWRMIADLVDAYNAPGIDKAERTEISGKLTATLDGLIPQLQETTRRTGGDGATSRLDAATALKRDLEADARRSEDATDEWMSKQAEQRRTTSPGKLKVNYLTQQNISDTMTNKQLEDDWRQTQLEFDGETGVNSRMGMTKSRTELKVAVNIPFKGDKGSIPAVKAAIDKYWNTFKITYESSNKEGQPPPVDRSVELKFVLGDTTAAMMKRPNGKEFAPVRYSHRADGESPQPPPVGGNWVRMGGYEGHFAVEPSDAVLLWSGDHPQYKARMAQGHSEADAKTRSDSANWRVNDADAEMVFAHEFGHLIGLPDEYSKRHGDITSITGKQPKSYDDSGALAPQHLKVYNQVKWAIDQTRQSAKNAHHINRAIDATARLGDGVLSLVSAHHDKETGYSLDRDLVRLKEEYKVKISAQSGRAARKAPNADYKTVSDAVAFAETDSWKQVLREGFRSGGIMGDFSSVGGAVDTRENAAAHDHQHPLEPRHVKRFADVLGTLRNEKWKPEHR